MDAPKRGSLTSGKDEFWAKGITINLLPKEILLGRLHSSKLVFIQKLSSALLFILLFFTSATLALRLNQNSQFSQAQAGLVHAQETVGSMQSKEAQVVVLKQRLSSIKSLESTDSSRKEIFNLIAYLISQEAQGIGITNMNIDKNGNMQLSINSSSLQSLDRFFSSLGDPSKNAGIISKVDLEGLSVSKSMVYQLDLKIIQKLTSKQ